MKDEKYQVRDLPARDGIQHIRGLERGPDPAEPQAANISEMPEGLSPLSPRQTEVCRKAPEEKLEVLVAKFDRELTAASNSFNSKGSDPLGTLREAQIMLGFVSTILTKAGLRE